MIETHLTLSKIATRNTKPIPNEFPTKALHELSIGKVSTEQITGFIGSSSTLMSKLPKSRSLVDLTAEIVSSLYLSLQINAINEILLDLSSGADSYYVAPLNLYRRPFKLKYVQLNSTTDRLAVHQQAVRDALQIQSVLRSPNSNMSIQVGAWRLGELSLLLGSMGMYKEAAKICGWGVRIFKTLVRIDREVYTPYLVNGLFNLSIFTEDHNVEAAHEAIAESVGIAWSLHMPTLLVRERSRVQLSRSLRRLAEILSVMGTDTQALLNASEAVRVLEELFSDHLSEEIPIESGFILREFKWDELLKIMEHSTIFEYAQALAILSSILGALEFPTAAIRVATNSLETFHLLSPLFPRGLCQEEIAYLLEHISKLKEALPL